MTYVCNIYSESYCLDGETRCYDSFKTQQDPLMATCNCVKFKERSGLFLICKIDFHVAPYQQ